MITKTKNSVLKLLFFFISVTAMSCTPSNQNEKSMEHSEQNASQSPLRVQAGNMGHLPWDPKSSEPVRWAFNAAVFSPLVSFDKQYSVIAGIISDWSWDSKDNSYLMKINSALKFGKGRAVTIEDVEFAIIKPFISSSDLKERQPLKGIVGVEKLKVGEKYQSGAYPGFKKISDNSFKIFLKRPDPTFLYSLGVSVPPVGPIEDFEDDMYTFKGLPDGTGPYKIQNLDKEKGEILLERKTDNSVYKVGPPTKIHFFTQKQGPDNNVDLGVMAGAVNTKNNPKYTRFVNDIPVAVQVIDFNYNNPYGKDKAFREALSLTIDRKEITGGYDQAHPLQELVPEMFYGRSNTKFEYDVEKAKKIVQEKFAKIAGGKKVLKAWYHGLPGEEYPRWFKRLIKQIESSGLKFELIGCEEQKMDGDDNDIVFYVYGTPITFVDPLLPFSFYTSDTVKPAHTNVKNEEYNRLYEAAKNSATKKERAKAIQVLSQYVQSEFLTIPIAERRPIFAHSKRVVEMGRESLFFTFDYEKVKLKK
ncbi:MAG: ABC transporter substrate-binding protein [Bdellovibrionales bacterium]|nr:ABC transporter substrate-binding protein [Bdellovibrionales bacterium]NQZ18036.1 ABC transporter substrate-binding protein [Bdellovibrionales bacterium]